MFKKLKTVIDKILTKQQKKEFLQFIEIKKRWKNKIDPNIQKQAKIIDFKNREVTIKTKNSAWRNELSFLKEEIKKKSLPLTTRLIKL